jgi:hypothetical protein
MSQRHKTEYGMAGPRTRLLRFPVSIAALAYAPYAAFA